MSTKALQDDQEVDFLDLPDDELPDYPPGDEPVEVAAENTEDTSADEDDVDNVNDEEEEDIDDEDSTTDGSLEDQPGEQDESGEGEAAEEEEGNEEESPEEGNGYASPDLKEQKPKGKKSKGKKTKNSNDVEEAEVSAVSAEDVVKQLFSPFRANGKEMQVQTVDDALTLMKMGANYNKKMAGLKPNLRLMKMLGNNDLLDEQKLSYLIDLNNKNPEAIAKLISDSGVDPLDIDTENPTDYTPNTYTVNDKELDLDGVLHDIEDTPSFQETIDIISNKLDQSSKKVLLETPSLIATINEHVGNGIYGQITGIIEQERTLGRLTGLSDLEAYKHVGDVLQSKGAFNQAPPQTPVAPSTNTAQAKQDPKLKNRKRAAAPTKSKPAKAQSNIDPLALSDEDFDKLGLPQFM